MTLSVANLCITALSIIAFCVIGIGEYDGHPVISVPYPIGFQINGFLYGSVLMHPDIYPESCIHELIHWEQQKTLGFEIYIVQIAIPSILGYWLTPEGEYYDRPWENPL